LARFEPATFGSSGKHTNHYTNKATVCGYENMSEDRKLGKDNVIIMKQKGGRASST
jgi:hypothetical protein